MARIKIADSIEDLSFNKKGLALVEADGRKVCLFRRDSNLLACVDRCPHGGGSLSEGYVDKNANIVCPVHHYRFNLKTGRDAMNEGYFLKRFAVVADEDGVFIDMS